MSLDPVEGQSGLYRDSKTGTIYDFRSSPASSRKQQFSGAVTALCVLLLAFVAFWAGWGARGAFEVNYQPQKVSHDKAQ